LTNGATSAVSVAFTGTPQVPAAASLVSVPPPT
jgi:hypothetical protein